MDGDVECFPAFDRQDAVPLHRCGGNGSGIDQPDKLAAVGRCLDNIDLFAISGGRGDHYVKAVDCQRIEIAASRDYRDDQRFPGANIVGGHDRGRAGRRSCERAAETDRDIALRAAAHRAPDRDLLGARRVSEVENRDFERFCWRRDDLNVDAVGGFLNPPVADIPFCLRNIADQRMILRLIDSKIRRLRLFVGKLGLSERRSSRCG